jgi:hypothetical protein
MRVWKWTLTVTDVQSLMLPGGARILDIQLQGEAPQLWALCDELATPELRTIAIYGTGNPMPERPGDIATFQTHGGALVWHAFELRGQ